MKTSDVKTSEERDALAAELVQSYRALWKTWLNAPDWYRLHISEFVVGLGLDMSRVRRIAEAEEKRLRRKK